MIHTGTLRSVKLSRVDVATRNRNDSGSKGLSVASCNVDGDMKRSQLTRSRDVVEFPRVSSVSH